MWETLKENLEIGAEKLWKTLQLIKMVKYALGSNLILSRGYVSTRPKTYVHKVLDPHLSSYAVQSQKSDSALRISAKITTAS